MKKLNLSKFKITHKGLYWGLIITFAILYLCVGFVSTLHSITFFGLANSLSLAILLGLTYEVGQASVLFSILMTKNKDTFLPWALMFLLTALQVTANVYASFKFMVTSGNNDWTYWQKSILFGVQASNAEMYQVIISWIAGALLPIVALGMTALVAQNIRLMTDETEEKAKEKVGSVADEEVDDVIKNEVDKRLANIINTKVTDFEKPSDLLIFDQNNQEDNKFIKSYLDEPITLEEQQNIKENITEEDRIKADLDKDVAELVPEIKDDVRDYQKQALEDFKDKILKDAKEIIPSIAIEETMRKRLQEEAQNGIFPVPILPPKTRGRPPKQKETAAAPKKEQGLLQKEENVRVPQEKPVRSRTIDPLKRKSTTTTVTDLNEVIKPSKGDEVIKLLESLDKAKTEETFTEPVEVEEISHESLLIPPELRTPYVEGGVEVIDAKAVPKQPEVKKNQN